MFGFTIVMTIAIGMMPVEKFRAHSVGQFSQEICIARASDYADLMIEYAKARAPYAIIQTEITCELRITRPV